MRIFEDRDIKINLPILIDSRMLLCANSGGGKSYAIRKILEEVGTGVMSIILDVEGEFKTLREKYDFLLIGQAGDVSINIKAAHLLPVKLMELNVSTIIDISDLKMHDRILYVKRFLEALMELPRKFWKPCLVIVDEAHMYCGQQEKQDSTHSVIDLMTRGRKRGYCGILATQRIAKLHKDAAAEANNYMVGRTGLDVDMKRAAEILGFASKADMLSLRDLDAGEFFVFGPAISRAVKKTKVAKVQTTHPKVGMDLRGKITPPTAKIKAMLAKLNDLPREAEEKTKTLEDLRKRNRELERELRKQPAARIDEKQIEAAEKRGFAEAENQYIPKMEKIVKDHQFLSDRLNKIVEVATIQDMPEFHKIKLELPIHHVALPAKIKSERKIYTERSQKSQQEINDEIKLNRCERSILSLLYNNGNRTFTKILIGVFTGYSNRSGGFNNAICHLNSLGLVARSGGEIAFNPQGQSEIIELLGNDVNLYEQFNVNNWAQNLPKCESTIFRFLMQDPSTEFTREEIGEGTNYSFDSGGFNNAICRLNSLGLIVRQGGRIKLNSEILEL
jgi:hypothetical protein